MNIIFSNTGENLGKFLLRITCGGLLLFHGWHKVFVEVEHVKDILRASNLPDFLAYGNIVGEFFAPLIIIIGYKARLGAIIVVINMIFSIILAHRDIVFSINEFGGWMIETNILYLMTALVIMFLGAGEYSISRGRAKWD